jgi:hypothetical protein
VVAVLLLSLLAGSLASSGPTSGTPTVVDNGDGNKTATWDFVTPSDYAATNVTIAGGAVRLARSNGTLVQNTTGDFQGNGTWDGNVVVTNGSVRLRQDVSNLVANGNFSQATDWAFASANASVLTASWNGTTETGQFSHADGRTLFDNLDVLSADWAGLTGSTLKTETTIVHEGSGALNISWDDGDTVSSPGGARRNGPLDWSNFSIVTMWSTTNYTGNLSFWIEIYDGSVTKASSVQTVTNVWQAFEFDLQDLAGQGVNLSSISYVDFKYKGAGQPVAAYLDFIELTTRKVSTTVAWTNQTFEKAVSTPAIDDATTLRFSYAVSAWENIANSVLRVRLNGSDGEGVWNFTMGGTVPWSPVELPVGAVVAKAGVYNLSFAVEMALNTTASTNLDVRIDDVNVTSPNYLHPGAYRSKALSVGSPALWLLAAWDGSAPGETEVRVRLRTGYSDTPGDSTWSAWSNGTSLPGRTALDLPPGTFVQFDLWLNTTNVTVTPLVDRLELTYAKYAGGGEVETATFAPAEDVVAWLAFRAAVETDAATAVTLAVSPDNGTTWRALSNPDSLEDLATQTLRFRATLSTTNTSRTPLLLSLTQVYAFRDALASIALAPELVALTADDTVQFAATGYDQWGHAVPFNALWTVDDPGGFVDAAGRYTPGRVGTWTVTVSDGGGAIEATATVVVSAGALARIDVSPNVASVPAGGEFLFTAAGYDGKGNAVPLTATNWRSDAGIFLAENATAARWRAQDTAGSGVVEAVHGSVVGQAQVTVTVPGVSLWDVLYAPWSFLGILALVGTAYLLRQWLPVLGSTVEDVFLISREGRLILHNTRRLRADRDEDILAGMLTAIMVFVRDSFQEESEDLRKFEFGDKTVVVERGRYVVAAAIFGGPVPRAAAESLRAFVEDVEERYADVLPKWSGDVTDLPGLREMTDGLVRQRRYSHGDWRRHGSGG